MRVEWPKGSGRVAEYEPHEVEFVKAVVARYERGEITGKVMKNEVEFLHEAKMLFGARLLSRREEIDRGYRLAVEGHREFRIPEVVQLALGGDSLSNGGSPPVTGRYHGSGATETERASGVAVELEDQGPLKPGGAGHLVLRVYADGRRRTAYDASVESSGDFHARRRESTRLFTRGLLVKDGIMANRAPNGREHVDAYRITMLGREELARLDAEA